MTVLWSASAKSKQSCVEKTPRHYCENTPTTPLAKLSTAQFDEVLTSQLATAPRFHANRSGESPREKRGTLHECLLSHQGVVFHKASSMRTSFRESAPAQRSQRFLSGSIGASPFVSVGKPRPSRYNRIARGEIRHAKGNDSDTRLHDLRRLTHCTIDLAM